MEIRVGEKLPGDKGDSIVKRIATARTGHDREVTLIIMSDKGCVIVGKNTETNHMTGNIRLTEEATNAVAAAILEDRNDEFLKVNA